MKKTRLFYTAISSFLTFCILFFSISTAALAVESNNAESRGDSGPIYTSLGDSATNGCGLHGYDGSSGVEDYGDGSYANRFAKYLNAKKHYQLAMSAMRVADISWLLQVDYNDEAEIDLIEKLSVNPDPANYSSASGYYKANIEEFNDLWYSVFSSGDFWTWKELVNNYRFDVAAYCIEGKDGGESFSVATARATYTDVEAFRIVAEYYQNAVKESDVISFSFGGADFGVWLYGRLFSIGMGSSALDERSLYDIDRILSGCDADLRVQIEEFLTIDDIWLEEYLKNSNYYPGQDEDVKYLCKYALVNFAINYTSALNSIVELNPDAEIILTGLINTYDYMDDYTDYYDISIGKIGRDIIGLANAYIKMLPTYIQAIDDGRYANATFYFSEFNNIQFLVETYYEEMNQGNNVLRSRFIESIVGTYNNPGMIWNILRFNSHDWYITLAEIENYECMSTYERVLYMINSGEKVLAINYYLAFEKAICESIDTQSTISLGDATGYTLNGEAMYKLEYIFSNSIYSNYRGIYFNEVRSALKYSGVDESTITNISVILELPESLSMGLTEDQQIRGLLTVFATSVIANGLGIHPSQMGHDSMCASIIEAYEYGETVNSKVLTEIYTLLDSSIEFIYASEVVSARNNGEIYSVVEKIEECENSLLQSMHHLASLSSGGEEIEEIINSVNLALDELKALKACVLSGEADDTTYFADIASTTRALHNNVIKLTTLLTNSDSKAVAPVLKRTLYWRIGVYKEIFSSLNREEIEFLGQRLAWETVDELESLGLIMMYQPDFALDIYNTLWNIVDNNYFDISGGCTHHLIDATCTTPMICFICDTTFGAPNGHNWVEATHTSPKTCSSCGETEGEPLPEEQKPESDGDKTDDGIVDSDTTDSNTTEDTKHECNSNAGWFKRVWNAIMNLFRTLFGKPNKCVCGEEYY